MSAKERRAVESEEEFFVVLRNSPHVVVPILARTAVACALVSLLATILTGYALLEPTFALALALVGAMAWLMALVSRPSGEQRDTSG